MVGGVGQSEEWWSGSCKTLNCPQVFLPSEGSSDPPPLHNPDLVANCVVFNSPHGPWFNRVVLLRHPNTGSMNIEPSQAGSIEYLGNSPHKWAKSRKAGKNREAASSGPQREQAWAHLLRSAHATASGHAIGSLHHCWAPRKEDTPGSTSPNKRLDVPFNASRHGHSVRLDWCWTLESSPLHRKIGWKHERMTNVRKRQQLSLLPLQIWIVLRCCRDVWWAGNLNAKGPNQCRQLLVFTFLLRRFSALLFVSWKKKTMKPERYSHLPGGQTTLVTQESRHISVLCDAPCTPSLFSLSSLWVLWRSGVERRGGWRWWRLAGQADIPRGQRTDGTWLVPHTSMPGILRSAPVAVPNGCLLQRWGSPGSEGDYWGLRAKNSQSGRRPRRIN